ncbi:hypothetical protein G647_10070 [Cladophialophora carrionii CBS 160.54]|uniref:Xylanolytic transcriptional activator regulatory domain-containing protein n=1 Tax=Cladophialophora carrionii CBS 160.54 TaxID=1279043 RepID=V9DJW1_9EURO|nr:uncharacterized protein G647_10070 [Cladophialophora carrionii CBS 160.54]ETI26971.1 hypothetical protein G647_10070 [Cladophialophora carrionii CBS 160.54]
MDDRLPAIGASHAIADHELKVIALLRKKTRCSGEKPVCAFCRRLNQRCTWDGEEGESPELLDDTRGPPASASAAAAASQNAALAARVALLESRLSFLDADNAFNLISSLSGTRNPTPPTTSQRFSQQPALDDTVNTPNDDFSSIPDHQMFRGLIDVYFERCHNQPYAYFHEDMFRQDYEAGLLPEYLLYAFGATACRFSDHPFYRERRSEAIEAYAQASFGQIFEHYFSDAEILEVYMVIALAMLAVVEFSAGRPKIGWVKLALSCRFAQALRLNEEPDPQLPLHEQEGRRRIFWSVYLLDILMSVGPNRPPSLLDEDCTVHLPCHEDLFREGLPGGLVPTLTEVTEYPSVDRQNLDSFAMTIVMASALGRFIRFSLKRTLNKSQVVWNPRSKYYEVHSILLFYESQSRYTFTPVAEAIRQRTTFNGLVAPSQISHIVFAHALYHLNQTLLNHPFILYRFFHSYTAPIPLSFAEEALQRCRKHATSLLELLTDLEQYGPFSHPSFYGYCAMAAGLIHRLYEKSEDPHIAETSRRHVRKALNFLQREPVRWSHVGHMGTLLRTFELDPNLATVLTDAVSLAQKVDVPHGAILWQLLDYAWLPQSKSSSEIRSSLADLLPGTASRQSSSPAGPSSEATNAQTIQFEANSGIPPTYARMLGEDM